MAKIDWQKMKVTYVRADPNHPNPMNPCAHKSTADRKREIIQIAADIWRRHCDGG